jgi:hypothetical protein
LAAVFFELFPVSATCHGLNEIRKKNVAFDKLPTRFFQFTVCAAQYDQRKTGDAVMNGIILIREIDIKLIFSRNVSGATAANPAQECAMAFIARPASRFLFTSTTNL